MGPSPPSSSAPAAPPSLLQDWFFRSAADRDTQILIQALTHELSTPPACHQALCAPPESGFAGPDSLPVLKALEEQHGQRHRRFAGLGEPPVSTAGSEMAMAAHGLHIQEGGLLVRENGCMQAGSPPSSSSLPASNPGSPYSTITTTSSSMSIPTDAHALVIHTKPAGMAPEGLLVNALTSTDACIHPNSSSIQLYRGGAAAALSMRPIRSSKAGKRRSRATSRSPIHVLSTDVSNFRAIVQQLTGIPSTSPMHRHANSSMNPPPLRNPHPNAAILPTLDTSAALLRCKPPVKDPLQGFSFTRMDGHQASGYPSSVGGYGAAQSTQNCDAAYPPPPSSGIPLYGQQSILNDQSRLAPSSPTLSSIWNYENDAKLEGDFPCFVQAQQFSTKQAMPPLDELAPMKAHYSSVDSWPFFDGVIANQAPHLEIARMA